MIRTIFIFSLSLSLLWPPSLWAADSKQPQETEEAYLQYSDQAAHFLFESTPHHLGQDLLSSVNQALMVWAVGSYASGLSYGADGRVQDYFDSHDWLGKSEPVFDQMGKAYTLGGITLLTLGSGYGLKDEKLKLLGETFAESLFLTGVLTLSLKYATQRERPDGSDSLAFPSAHTATTFALATDVAVIYGPWAGLPAYALASTVALSRLDSNEHHLSDVVFGATLGTALALGTAQFHKKENPSLFIYPQLSTKTYGLGARYAF